MADHPSEQPHDHDSWEEPSNGLAIASLVLGIISIPLFCFPFISIPCAIAGIVLGIVAKVQINKGAASGSGMAVGGIVCGAAGIVVMIIMTILFFIGAAFVEEQAMEMRERIEEQRQQRKQQMQEQTQQRPEESQKRMQQLRRQQGTPGP